MYITVTFGVNYLGCIKTIGTWTNGCIICRCKWSTIEQPRKCKGWITGRYKPIGFIIGRPNRIIPARYHIRHCSGCILNTFYGKTSIPSRAGLLVLYIYFYDIAPFIQNHLLGCEQGATTAPRRGTIDVTIIGDLIPGNYKLATRPCSDHIPKYSPLIGWVYIMIGRHN